MVRPTDTDVGLNEGATVFDGAKRIGPKLAEKVKPVPVPGLLVAVTAVTFTTRYLSTQALFSGTVADVSAVEVQPAGTEEPAGAAFGHWYQR